MDLTPVLCKNLVCVPDRLISLDCGGAGLKLCCSRDGEQPVSSKIKHIREKQ